jgi:hypothetical protein
MTRFEDRFEKRLRAFARTGVPSVDSAAVARHMALGYPKSAATRPRVSGLGGVHRARQRAVFGPWRTRSMYKTALGAAAAIILLVLGTGLWLGVSPNGNTARPSVSAPTAPLATTSPRPSASPQPTPAILKNGPILVAQEGTYRWIDPVTGRDSSAGALRLPEGIDEAAWSRDGRELAIVVRGNLEVVDPSTGVRRVVATCADLGWACDVEGERGHTIDWSPDGVTIAATSEMGLLVVDVPAGRVTNILKGAAVSHPSWSPDGRTIAFEYSVPYNGRQVGALREIQLIERDGSNRRPLSGPPDPESIGFTGPFWSPDGTRIVYLGSEPWNYTGDIGWKLSVMALNLADGELAGPPVKLLEIRTSYCTGYCPSIIGLAPDGSTVLIDDDGLVIARLDKIEKHALGTEGRVLAWRPVP